MKNCDENKMGRTTKKLFDSNKQQKTKIHTKLLNDRRKLKKELSRKRSSRIHDSKTIVNAFDLLI